MKLVMWGDWLPDHVESLVQEMRIRSVRPRLTVQLDPAAKSVDFCNVQADEFVRAEAIDPEALLHCLEAQGSARLALHFWYMLAHPRFDAFLERFDRIAAKAESVVCWLPRPWAATGAGALFSLEDPELRTLFQRTREAFEFIWNGGRTVGAVLSAPSREHLEVVSGRQGLGPLVRLGLSLWPSEMAKSDALFVDRQHASRAILNALEFEGRAPTWMVEAAAEQSFKVAASEGARKGFLPTGVSWEHYCQPPLLPHMQAKTYRGIALPRFAQWLYMLGAVEASGPTIQQQREVLDRAVFPR